MREWKRLEEAALQQNHDLLRCPACADEPHAIHMDGNSKLYRYSKAGGLVMASSYNYQISNEYPNIVFGKGPASKLDDKSSLCILQLHLRFFGYCEG